MERAAIRAVLWRGQKSSGQLLRQSNVQVLEAVQNVGTAELGDHRVVFGGAMIKTYRIEEYDPERPGVVTFINYFELESGRFLRREKVCE